jgi:uncharacterized protein (DUF302 family)
MRQFLAGALALVALVILAVPAAVAGPDGLIMKRSNHSVSETLDRLSEILESKGLTIFTRVDHAANAAGTDLELRPTQVLIFGNPKLGTPLMQSNPTIAIDLPQKALAFEDAEGQVWLAYNIPEHLAKRHDIADRDEVIGKIANALDALTDKAVE